MLCLLPHTPRFLLDSACPCPLVSLPRFPHEQEDDLSISVLLVGNFNPSARFQSHLHPVPSPRGPRDQVPTRLFFWWQAFRPLALGSPQHGVRPGFSFTSQQTHTAFLSNFRYAMAVGLSFLLLTGGFYLLNSLFYSQVFRRERKCMYFCPPHD